MFNHKKLWQDKICNIIQVGGIETSILDNGIERGNRIAWFNTGSGLRYKVILDRAMDIGEAFFDSYSLSWLSHSGFTAPRPDANKGLEWLRSFGGGLLTTCGLSHYGTPEDDSIEPKGLHGRISNIPAQIESIIQPNCLNNTGEMSVTGIIKETKVYGPNIEIRRTIKSYLGVNKIEITDNISNCGNTKIPIMLLYHCNFGWPLVDEGTDIIYKGKCISRDSDMNKAIFNGKSFRKCLAPQKTHCGTGEFCFFIKPKSDRKSVCHAGLVNRKIGIALKMTYKKEQFPLLTNWQHFGMGEYVCALEPGTKNISHTNNNIQEESFIFLKPSETKIFTLCIEIMNKKNDIDSFVKSCG